MKVLWAPWRMAYIDGAKEKDCIFCTKIEEGEDRPNLVLGRSLYSLVMLNKYPYNSGHLLLAPKKHESSLCGLAPEEYGELCKALKESVEIVMDVLKPTGINLGMNLGRSAGAGVEDHLHWHVVPRWEGDTNFMPVVAESRVIPQHLLDSYDRLSPSFRNFLGGGDDQGP